MVYEFSTEVREITLSEVNGAHPTMGFVTLEEFRRYAPALGFAESTLEECESNEDNFRGAMDLYDTYSFGVLYLVNVTNVFGQRDRIGVYIKKNLLLLVEIYDEDKSTQHAFLFAVEHAQKGHICMERLICLVLERILYGSGKAMERMGYDIDAMGQEFVGKMPVKEFNNVMLQKKRELLLLQNYYEQLIDIGEELQENNGGFFTTANLRFFRLFTDKVTRLSSNTYLLRESLMQVRQSYDTALDFNQSQVMKAFATLTAIFAPLSLITNWYGMNFENMPMLQWHYGPYVVIGLSVLAVGFCVLLIWRNNRKL